MPRRSVYEAPPEGCECNRMLHPDFICNGRWLRCVGSIKAAQVRLAKRADPGSATGAQR